VEEGDAVVAGETELFKVDDLKLQKAVEVRTHEVAVARCALREKEALQDEIAAGLEKVKMDLARLEKLYRDEAIPLDRLEQQQTRYRQAEAKMDHAESLVSLAGEQVRQAEASLAMAQKDLADTVTVAPVSGMVSGKYFELGEMAESGKPVLRIDDGSLIEVSAFLPAESYPRIQTGGTAARIMVYGHDAGQHVVSYKAPRIHSTLRTFEVRWLIEDPAEGVAPGAMAEIGVVLRERDGLGVPADAIQLRRSGPVVFTVAKGTAHRHDVRTGIESGGWTELMGAPFEEGTSVVTMGQSQLEEGAAVEVRTSGETDSGV
jgi:RND family efflux transporter MFP subunit